MNGAAASGFDKKRRIEAKTTAGASLGVLSIHFLPSRYPLDPLPLLLELDVFPRVGVARGDGREHVLPFLGSDARADCVHEGVTEYRHDEVVFQDRTLHL